MFLQFLTPEQQRGFMVLATRLTMADGDDAEEEQEALEALQQEIGQTFDIPVGEVLGDLVVSSFDTPTARTLCMLELLVLAYADEYLHEAESLIISEIAVAFGIGQDQLNDMAVWAGQALLHKRNPTPDSQNALVEEAYAMIGD